ncbi:D-alanine--D-alanine ligase [Spiribacter pallidus]|uniref:D-alanine--D-alanine ligase n=1 Tax=Spiribacter pallidus TaxID=1987936 RepID=A0ABV3TA72_9GAMM
MVTEPMPTAADMGRVAVMMGGASAERAISLASGQTCLDALVALGVDAEAFDPLPRPLADLTAFDRAFIALHGPGGEDGTMQGALESLDIPYTGSGVLGSALGMDKLRSKQIWQALGLPTPAYRVVTSADSSAAVAQALGFPVFVKPLREGSSLGTTPVDHEDDLAAAVAAARQYGEAALVERCIVGTEYTVAVLGDEILPPIRIDVAEPFYDFEAKYRSEATRMTIPCGLSAERESALQGLARDAFAAIDARGWGRVDVMADERGDFWLLEVNTIPGMTDHSLVPAAAAAHGLDMATLVWRILLTSWRHGEAT